MTRASFETDVVGDQCSIEGCRARWTCEFGFGKFCSHHDAARRDERRTEKAQTTIPDLPPVARHWTDGRDFDEEPLPF